MGLAVCETIGELWIQTRIATSFDVSFCAYLWSYLENYRLYMEVLHIELLL